jgi:hypothetical protein
MAVDRSFKEKESPVRVLFPWQRIRLKGVDVGKSGEDLPVLEEAGEG